MMKKKLVSFALAAAMSLTTFSGSVLLPVYAAEDAASEITEGMCETPALLTSIGQSADVDIAKTLCTKGGIEVTTNATATADDLDDSVKTLILAVGGSSKGLGAAGIDADQELERTEALLAKAKELGITILAMHTGGSARRGTLSDSFIGPAFAAADVAVVVSEGDGDGMMAGILSENNTPAAFVDKAASAMAVLKTIFGVE